MIEASQAPAPTYAAHSSAMLRKLTVTLAAMAAYAPLAVDMYLPAFPSIAQELGTTVGRVQLTLASFVVGMAAGQILWGTLSDRMGRKLPLIIGCSLSALASVALASTDSITTLIVVRFLMGLGGSVGLVVSRAIVRDLFEQREAARFYSLVMIIGGVGPVVAPFLGTLWLTRFSWRANFWAMALFGVLCVAAVMLLIPETLPVERRTRGPATETLTVYGRLLADQRFLVPAMAVGCTTGILYSYLTNSSFVFIQLYHVPLALFSVLFAANSIGFFAVSQVNRVLLRRSTSPEQLLRWAMWVSLVSGLLLVVCAYTGWGGFALIYGGLFVCLSTLGIIFPNGTAMTLQPFAAQAGTASAMLGLVQYTMSALAGTASGLTNNGTALPMAVQIVCFALVARGFVLLTARKRARANG